MTADGEQKQLGESLAEAAIGALEKAAVKMGRPTKYSKKLANRICELLSSGESLRGICLLPDMPDRSTILRWAMDPKHEFHDLYERAREIQIHSLVDDMQDIADDGSNDYYEKEGRDGRTCTAVDHDNINRSKLRVQYRQWLAERVLRRMYGNKVDHELTGKNGGPMEIRWAEPDEVDSEDAEAAGDG